jgi:release factor glutamine methyltransferase
MPAIKDWIIDATRQLDAAGINSGRLDAEIILSHCLRRPRTYVHAHNDEQLDGRTLEVADARLLLRLDRVPIAYIIGHKDFYGRRFSVTTSTLIPRPESETLIDELKNLAPKNLQLFDNDPFTIVDVGTGSGCLGITAKLELPDSRVTLLDISPYALKVAASNASRLHADVHTAKSNLLSGFPLKAHVILANLPYVDPSWDVSPETAHEPALALFADDEGLVLIEKLIDQAALTLHSRGNLILEADPRQHARIVAYATNKKRFSVKKTIGFCVVLKKN